MSRVGFTRYLATPPHVYSRTGKLALNFAMSGRTDLRRPSSRLGQVFQLPQDTASWAQNDDSRNCVVEQDRCTQRKLANCVKRVIELAASRTGVKW